MKKVAIFLLLTLCVAGSWATEFALEGSDNHFAHIAQMYYTATPDGDSVLSIVLKPVFCFSRQKFRSKKAAQRYYNQYYRMIYNVKKVYPYAVFIREKLKEMDKDFVTLSTEKERKAYIKRVEKELFAKFEPEVRNMTISQGKILIKLIDRETQRTGYSIIKEMKGGFTAFFWQAVATMFSSSLKMEFDPQKEDKILNEIIILYESGLL
ncbi:hypothetical protein AGMMS4956_11640 [Bacteroidia bacterium]|nr:hypothetical protein AGMMS4956_11640 [Bacteroidia bacterium]